MVNRRSHALSGVRLATFRNLGTLKMALSEAEQEILLAHKERWDLIGGQSSS